VTQAIRQAEHIAEGEKYEPGTIQAEGDFAIVDGRFSGFGAPINWIAVDLVRIEDGILVEHGDMIQDEASRACSKSGLPMFCNKFGECPRFVSQSPELVCGRRNRWKSVHLGTDIKPNFL
jgi:hypothetical protein